MNANILSWFITLANPKSPNFTLLLESKNILPGFKSLCNIFCGNSYSSQFERELYEIVFEVDVAVLPLFIIYYVPLLILVLSDRLWQ